MAGRRGADLLVEALEASGADRIFCVPGESYLAVLDALADSPIRLTVARHEGGAGMMAEADGKLTGRPGIAFVTRGPGATNAAHALHIARQDSTPMILFIGQVERAFRDREAFQEIDYSAFFSPIVKWAAEIREAERVPEYVLRAWRTAVSGRPGPVVLSLPEDMLTEEVAGTPQPSFSAPAPEAELTPDLDRVGDLLEAVRRPFAILGGSRWSERAVADFTAFAEAWRLPVACSFRRQHLFDHRHPLYAGDVGIGINPKLRARIEGADLLLVVGARLGEMPSQGYSLLDVPFPRQTLVHVHPGPEEIGKVYRPALGINLSPVAFAAALSRLSPSRPLPWAESAAEAHADYLAWSAPPRAIPGRLQMGEIMEFLNRSLPDDAVLTNGAGNFATWVHRFYRFRRYGTQLAPTSGSMGYGLPAAIAAKLRHPERMVMCFAGDGCFQMTMNEFATAVEADARVIVLVIDNGMYGTIRMHQERHYPGRVVATDLRNPDFAAYARACGGHGETVRETSDFAPAFERAAAAGKPALLHLLLDKEAITPTRTLSEIRAG